jgi:hypothetical protein
MKLLKPTFDYATIYLIFLSGLSLKEIRQIYDWNCCPEDLAMIEKMDSGVDADEEEMRMIKWAGAGGRRRTISITI